MGYDIYDYDPRFEERSYYQEYEDTAELTRKLKNYVEGYRDSMLRIKKRLYLLKNSKDFYDSSVRVYRNTQIK